MEAEDVGTWIGWRTCLDIPPGKSGDFEIDHIILKPGGSLETGNLRTALFGQPKETIVFPKGAKFHRLSEGGGVWMTDLPIEQAQHRELLKGMAGRVLVGGLGLGYAAQCLLNRPEITLLDVVEISPDVIKLVKPHLKHAEGRLYIHEGDIFEFLKGYQGKGWDWVYFDTWQSDGEHTFHKVVCPLRELVDPFVESQATVQCWNEDVMRGQLLMALQTRTNLLVMKEKGPIPPGLDVFDLDEMATLKGDIWWDWSVPFWQYAQKAGLPRAMEQMNTYAQVYGLPGWREDWQKMIDRA